MNQEQKRLYLIEYLLSESGKKIDIPIKKQEQIDLLRSLLNTRPAIEATKDFLKVQDEYLKARIAEVGIVDSEKLEPMNHSICVWQGDITTLKCDAIVNAANSGLTGCWIPNHKCIDNCIHTFAGIQLRRECDKIIENQGFTEPFGQAKITDAYNLPCKKIIHTVGPIVDGNLTDKHRELLEQCYISCLKCAEKNNLKSIAFCCISTGVFHFPNVEAAKIATSTCKKFLNSGSSLKKIIFNVFLDKDKKIYENLLSE